VTLGDDHDAAWWRALCAALRSSGYDDVLSTEHEDFALPAPEGIRRSAALLAGVIGRSQRHDYEESGHGDEAAGQFARPADNGRANRATAARPLPPSWPEQVGP
jgi:hypothetical protein